MAHSHCTDLSFFSTSIDAEMKASKIGKMKMAIIEERYPYHMRYNKKIEDLLDSIRRDLCISGETMAFQRGGGNLPGLPWLFR